MNTTAQSRIVRCRVSAWIMGGLSILWTGLSIPAFSELQSIDDWNVLGPMEWLCLMLVAIHIVLVAATVWVWLQTKTEVIAVNVQDQTDKRFASVLPAGFILLCVSGWMDSWLSEFVRGVGGVLLFAALVLMLRDIRATRNLAEKLRQEQNEGSS